MGGEMVKPEGGENNRGVVKVSTSYSLCIITSGSVLNH